MHGKDDINYIMQPAFSTTQSSEHLLERNFLNVVMKIYQFVTFQKICILVPKPTIKSFNIINEHVVKHFDQHLYRCKKTTILVYQVH